MKNKFYREGRRAYFSGKRFDSCPYDLSTKQKRKRQAQWTKGFLQAWEDDTKLFVAELEYSKLIGEKLCVR